MTTSPRIDFRDGRSIPQLGYGVWQVENEVAADVVRPATATWTPPAATTTRPAWARR